MKRVFLVLTVALALLLAAGVGTAAASPPASQSSGQTAGSGQEAGAAAGTAQQEPANRNISVRVLSPGDDGSVSQSNTASSNATAANLNRTDQNAEQAQAGGSGTQAVGQSAMSAQDALALGETIQTEPSNENISVRVLSPGNDGSVSQSNEASSNAEAGNMNATKQAADQSQAGSDCCGGAGSQVVGQSADNDQEATALSATQQTKPSNSNVSVRVLSPGNDGSVSQSNTASSNAEAGNGNWTDQSAEQAQAGHSCKCGGAGTQIVGQSAESEQGATALSATQQTKPSNSNSSVRVLSPGHDGSVSQSNEASSNAEAGNTNWTKQAADQGQGAGSGMQVVGQSADNAQSADALAMTHQEGASNENAPIRVLSPGDGGSVSQSNTASSNAEAGNGNWTDQSAEQAQAGASCKCGGAGTQIVGQSAESEQGATALSATQQTKPSNSNSSVRVLSPGHDGSVSQSNEASSNAEAGNTNWTKQAADQGQGAGSGMQVVGQSADNAQSADALAMTHQEGASNENAPIRVLSPGDGGSVSQSNTASSNAEAGNGNWTDQSAEQAQGKQEHERPGYGCCGAGIQAIGQSAQNEQGATALAVTEQLGLKPPCHCGDHSSIGNSHTPVRTLSPGHDPSVRQSNEAASTATAVNWNATLQGVRQLQAPSCGCKGDAGIQAVGQSDKTGQRTAALAASAQRWPYDRVEHRKTAWHRKDRR